jgi:hypothetical protein
MRFEEHKWCYDADGLIYQLKQSGRFNNIIEVKLGDELLIYHSHIIDQRRMFV